MPHSERKNTTYGISNLDEQLLCQNTAVYHCSCSGGKQRLRTAVTCVLQAKALPADSNCCCQSRLFLLPCNFDAEEHRWAKCQPPPTPRELTVVFSSFLSFSSAQWPTFSSFFLYPSLPSYPFPLSWTPLISLSCRRQPGMHNHFQRHVCVVTSPQVVKLCISGHSTSDFHLLRKNS